jgi:hypothetical protein
MLKIDSQLTAKKLLPRLNEVFELSAGKINRLEKRWPSASGSPVFTVKGKYATRGWTEWTQGFQFGSSLLQFDGTGDRAFLELGRTATIQRMAPHLSHIGVHDHGFNNISTYGNLLRLVCEGYIEPNPWERNFYELALKVSGAVQAARWTQISPQLGYVYSFNGPHSLFCDTIRSMRALAVSHQLGHRLRGEQDTPICLLPRMLQHIETTLRFNVFFGEGRDIYDVRGRVAHEAIFNINDGSFRCPDTQQGYSPFSSWTRGQAWVLLGCAEQLEFIKTRPQNELTGGFAKPKVLKRLENAARAVADFWLARTPTDGIPYWDTAAPGLAKMGDYLSHASDPFNRYEPVDSSAAAITAQGLLRLGNYLQDNGETKDGLRYRQAGLTISSHLFDKPYLSRDGRHEGLILHSVYHRPNGWDYRPPGSKIPNNESSMWGDYHARELALLLLREATGKPYYVFFPKS